MRPHHLFVIQYDIIKIMLKKIFKFSNLKYLAAFLIPLIFVIIINQNLDNDSWDVLAEGRYIISNGIYYTDTLSMHEGLDITVQNYGFATIFYLIYSIFGSVGIYVSMLILNFIVCLLLYKIYMLLSNKNTNLSLLTMVITNILLALGFVATRAQMIDYVILLSLIYLLEKYVKTSKIKYLWWIPLFSFLQINLHASSWWMLILIILVYIIDSFKIPKLHLQGYKTKPLIITMIASLTVGLINPYGIKMITLIFTSYGNTTLQNLVSELQAFRPFSRTLEMIVYLSIVADLLLLIFGNKKNLRIRHLLMFFGFLALGLNTIKGLSQFILIMFLPAVSTYKDVKIEKQIDAKIGRNALCFWSGILTFCCFAVLCFTIIPQIPNRPHVALVKAVDQIDALTKDTRKTNLKIYTGYNNGGYLEYRGYKPYLDPRGEVFLKKNNNKADILQEWVDFKNGKITKEDFLTKYSFDFLFVDEEQEPFKNLHHPDYELIYTDNNFNIEIYKHITQ